jgi:transcriptional regulator with XRE-family HTH domain
MKTAQTLDPQQDVKIRFGQVLKKLRAERKAHSLRSLGSVLGVTAKFVWEIENGVHLPSDELIYKIAREFRIKETKLFRIAKRVPYSVRHAIERDGELSELVASLVKADTETIEAVRKLLQS